MKNNFTLRQLFAYCFALMALLYLPQRTQGQLFNWGITANATSSTGSGTGAFGPPKVINDTINNYPAISDVHFIQTNGWIKIWWPFSAPVGKIDKIILFKNGRPITSCTISHYNGLAWVYDMDYVRTASPDNNENDAADSIFLPTPIVIHTTNAVDTIMLSNVQSVPQNNPDFREIQLWNMGGNCTGVAPTITARIFNAPDPQAGPAPLLSPTLITCPGYAVFLSAVTAATEKGHGYQWKMDDGTGWKNIPGATNAGYIFNGVGYTAQFKLIDTCLFSNLYDSSNIITVNYTTNFNAYNALGYVTTFDNTWQSSSCITAPYARDLPASTGGIANWSNDPPYGYTTWRIDTTTVGTSLWTSSSLTSNAYDTAFATYPYGTVFPVGSRRSARLRTGNTAFPYNTVGNLDLYMDFSGGPAGDKALYFYYINKLTNNINNDSLRVLMSTDTGRNWTLLGSYDTAQFFKKRMVPIQSSTSTIIRFQGYKYGNDNSDIGLDSVYIAPPCIATPVAGKIKAQCIGCTVAAGQVTLCPGTPINLTTLGASMAGGLVFQWEESTNGGVSYNPIIGGYGYNNPFFTTPPIYDTVRYRLKLQCGSTGTAVYSDTILVILSSAQPNYVNIPYKQSFDTVWANGCTNTQDIPMNKLPLPRNWTNYPYTGNNSWRLDNNASLATVWSVSGTGIFPGIPTSPRYARFHSSAAQIGMRGNLDVLYNGSSVPGNKELKFSYNNTSGNDSMIVYSSADGGANFTKLGTVKITPLGWTQFKYQAPCNSPNCVIRFQGCGDLGNQSDIGLDSVIINPPCTGQPVAGTISNYQPCPGETFTISLSGTSNVTQGSVQIEWYYRTSTSVPWSLLPDTTTYHTDNIFVNTKYMVVVKCLGSGLADTTYRDIFLAPFYWCYCNSGATAITGPNIGNVNIKKMPAFTNVLNNGSATPNTNNPTAIQTYSDFRFTVPPAAIYLDSTYQLFVSQINSGQFQSPGATITAWIDSDRNGTFDPDEVFMQQNSVNTTIPPQQTNATFSLPTGTPVGLTGMRVIIQQGINGIASPCGPYATGETEDYLIDIRYHPCGGPTYAGIAEVSDTAGCVGLTVTLVDTTHEAKRYGIDWVWQYSPDSNSWANVPGSNFRDTVVTTLTALTYYRLRMICKVTFDTTYSNVQKVIVNPPYACYCLSYANGGSINDTSDIGGFMLDTMLLSSDGWSGSHLYNQWATRDRTDFTKNGVIDLWVDSTYPYMIFHTIRTGFHADAKVTLFIDLNNDLTYNVGGPFNERLLTAYTSASNFMLVDSITIPHYAIPNTLTGMRLIINNDVGPNKQSDSACGPYTSGETEDYVVRLHVPFPMGVSPLDNISRMVVYPNPTEGLFTVSFEAKKAVDVATITVTNITGQVITQKVISKPGKKMSEEIDLTKMARGVYMVELLADNERQVRKLIVK